MGWEKRKLQLWKTTFGNTRLTMKNITYERYSIGDLRIKGTETSGKNGPEFPEIQLRAEADFRPYKSVHGSNDEQEIWEYTITSLSGDLRLKEDQGRRENGKSVCRLDTDFDPVYVHEPIKKTSTFRGRLTPQQVSEINKRRQEGNVHLEVECELSLYFQDPPGARPPFDRVRESIQVTIPRSHWTDNVYPSLGGREVFVIEIPKGKKSIEVAWTKIEDAKDAYENWNVEGASIACREAADAMDRAVREHYGSGSCVYEQRWQRAYDGVEHQASFAGHFQQIKEEANCERPEELRVGQADLECLIIRTQSLLKYAEALLRERKE